MMVDCPEVIVVFGLTLLAGAAIQLLKLTLLFLNRERLRQELSAFLSPDEVRRYLDG